MAPSTPSCACRVVTHTWTRDVHNLYDFEAAPESVKVHTFQYDALPGPMMCTRAGHEVQSSFGMSHHNPTNSEHLVQVAQTSQGLYVDRSRWGMPGLDKDRRVQRCWLLYRGDKRHKLSENDILKFGRAQFKVRKLIASAPEGHKVGLPIHDETEPVVVDPSRLHEYDTTPCRICLSEGSTEEDPLIAPCKCTGSVGHVHVNCLRFWIKERLRIPDEGSFVYRPPLCELCKSDYRMTVKLPNKCMQLVELPLRSPPVVVLESCSDRRWHVLSLQDNKPIKIGRGHDCDMSVSDTSISRTQATITVENGEFFLADDNSSRFGTFVKMRKGMHLKPGQDILIQVGRTLLEVSAPLYLDSAVDQVSLPSTDDTVYHDATSDEHGTDEADCAAQSTEFPADAHCEYHSEPARSTDSLQ